MATVRVHGTSIYYEAHGAGPTVVFAHGVGGNTLSWFQQLPELSRRYRVIAFDHRGWGRSECDPAYVDASYFAEDLLAVLDTEGVQRAAVIGHSIGAWTGLRVAIDSPERVSALVLCGDTGGLLTPSLIQAIKGLTSRLARGEPWWDDLVAPGFREREPALAFLHHQILALNPPLDPSKVEQTVEHQVRREELIGFRVPTLLLTGERDELIPADLMREAAAVIPGIETYAFGEAGNSPYFELASEFNRVVSDFLRSHLPA